MTIRHEDDRCVVESRLTGRILSEAEAAARIGVTPQTLASWRRGATSPTVGPGSTFPPPPACPVLGGAGVVFAEWELDAWIRRRRVAAAVYRRPRTRDGNSPRRRGTPGA